MFWCSQSCWAVASSKNIFLLIEWMPRQWNLLPWFKWFPLQAGRDECCLTIIIFLRTEKIFKVSFFFFFLITCPKSCKRHVLLVQKPYLEAKNQERKAGVSQGTPLHFLACPEHTTRVLRVQWQHKSEAQPPWADTINGTNPSPGWGHRRLWGAWCRSHWGIWPCTTGPTSPPADTPGAGHHLL